MKVKRIIKGNNLDNVSHCFNLRPKGLKLKHMTVHTLCTYQGSYYLYCTYKKEKCAVGILIEDLRLVLTANELLNL